MERKQLIKLLSRLVKVRPHDYNEVCTCDICTEITSAVNHILSMHRESALKIVHSMTSHLVHKE